MLVVLTMATSRRIWFQMIFRVSIIFGLEVGNVLGFHATAHCVQVGQANFNRNCDYSKTCHYSQKLGNGYHTIGAYKFRTTHQFLDSSFGPPVLSGPNNVNNPFVPPRYFLDTSSPCPYQYHPQQLKNVELCPTDDVVEIRTYAVKQNGVVMQGWLHFEVLFWDHSDSIMGIYIQVRDEWYNAIGEFVTKQNESCAATTFAVPAPSPYQVLPCSAVGSREVKLSSALFMVERDLLENPSAGAPFLHQGNISRGVHFTWRLSEYWCNRHLRFRPEVMIFTRKMRQHDSYNSGGEPKVYRKLASYWLSPRWYGSADIRIDATQLSCNEKVIDYKNSGGTIKLEKYPDGSLVAPWLFPEAQRSTLDTDYLGFSQQYYDPSFGSWSLQSCHANTRLSSRPTFAGRCTHHFEKNPTHSVYHTCDTNPNGIQFMDFPANLPTYTEEVEALTVNRSKLCSAPCRPPTNMEDLKAIQQFVSKVELQARSTLSTFDIVGSIRNGSKVRSFWAGRKFHGQILTFWSMFLIPVGTFASRYMKESHMDRSCIVCHIWLWIHLFTTLLGGALLGCGFLALYDILNAFGRSLNEFSKFHRGLGIASMVLFVLMALLGGIRPMTMTARTAFMLVHSVLGFLIYFLNMIAIILSCWIPASPSMPHNCDEEGRPVGFSGIGIVTTWWLLLDICIHIGMTGYQILIDRRYDIRRAGFYCPIVPFLPQDSQTDMKGKLRTVVFLVYVLLAFIYTMTVIGLLAMADKGIDERCMNLTGPSTCEDPWGCSNWAMAYSKLYAQSKVHPKAAN